MNPGLVFLLRKYFTGRARHFRRQLHGTKGKLMLLGAVLLLVFIIAPQIVLISTSRSLTMSDQSREAARLWAPIAMLTLAALSVLSGWGVHFSSAEMDFLFPAPISRRSLLAYNLLNRMQALSIASIWMAIFIAPYAAHWYSAVIAAFAAQAMVHVTSQCAGLGLAAVALRIPSGTKRAMVAIFVISPLLAFVLLYSRLPEGQALVEEAEIIASSMPVFLATVIYRPAVEIYLAPSLLSLAGWTVASLAVGAVMVLVMTQIDAAYLEGAIKQSQKVEERLKRWRSGASTFGSSAKRLNISVPHFPVLGGVGPIAWRQTVDIARNLNTVLFTVAFLGLFLFVAPVLATTLGFGPGSSKEMTGVLTTIVVLGGSVSLTQHLGFDFRRDLDRMAYIRSLPISPFAMTLGQLLPSAVLFSVIQGGALAILALVNGMITPSVYFALLLPLMPLNWMVVAIDNLIFLFIPHRIAPSGPGDFQALGRTAVVMILKMLAISLGLALGATLGVPLWMASRSPFVAALGVTVGFGMICVVLSLFVALAFRSLDLSRDVPA